jgi:hypothetical protein
MDQSAQHLGRDEARIISEYDSLDAVAQVQLRQDPADMSLNGVLFNHQFARDVVVGQAAGDLAQYVKFARGQPVGNGVCSTWPVPRSSCRTSRPVDSSITTPYCP